MCIRTAPLDDEFLRSLQRDKSLSSKRIEALKNEQKFLPFLTILMTELMFTLNVKVDIVRNNSNDILLVRQVKINNNNNKRFKKLGMK